MDVKRIKTPRRTDYRDNTKFRVASGSSVSEDLATKVAHIFQVVLYFSRKSIH